MQKHILQADHNKNFHNCIKDKFPDDFYDWKITVLFYVSIHYLKALAAKKGVDIGETHKEIETNVNPDRNPVLFISKTAWLNYKAMYYYSRVSRYDGVLDECTFMESKKNDYCFCEKNFQNFEKYIQNFLKK